MKKKLIAIVLTALCVCSLCAVLASCSDNKAAFVGTWNAEIVESNGQVVNYADKTITSPDGSVMNMQDNELTDQLSEYVFSLTLNQDGSAIMTNSMLGGAGIDCKWSVDNANEITITYTNDMLGLTYSYNADLVDGKLVLDTNEDIITCVKE